MKPIKTETEYQAAMTELRRLWGSKEKNAEDRLVVLTVLIEQYESEHENDP